MRKVLLLSNSTLHGSGFLEYAREYIQEFFNKHGVKTVLFVPYANVESEEAYTAKVREELGKWGYQVTGLNEAPVPLDAVQSAECIFIGGGNTFLLLKKLQDHGLLQAIRARVLGDGIPYMGSSAGTNVATTSINTTNDMPIVHPSSFEAIGLVPFNINPHYLDTDERSTHMGETREARIQEYHSLPHKAPHVLGLREGSLLHILGNRATLGGLFPARLFKKGEEPQEFPPGADLSFLLA